MGTTNILDLNNRLTKVEKESIAQNSYTSLKNKPKINSVTLTGNKSLADIGAAAAADLTTLAGNVGDMAQLTTTDKSSTVAAINEVNYGLTNLIQEISGVVEVTGVSNDWVYLNVTFTKPFKSVPLVTVNIFSTGADNNWYPPMLKNLTKNGFMAGWYNASGTKDVVWQAIGVKDDTQ